MYTDFYGLNEKPFDLTTSPRFLYLSEGHKEALAVLTYGVMECQGFILLTGEVGTGKSTMVQALLSNLDKSVIHAHLSNPLLSVKEFISYLGFAAFTKWVNFKSKAEFLYLFEEFLSRCHQHQKHFILIIDEAHKLSFELLEEIRLLSNMEKAEEKLLSIFLVGQPELNVKLRNPKCRALLQRISTRYNIPPLNKAETKEYMGTRLRVAGAKGVESVFAKDAVDTIYDFSQGYPRTINILADNALLLGYSRGKKQITSEMVRTAYKDLRLDDDFIKASSQLPNRSGPEEKRQAGSPRSWFWIVLLIAAVAAAAFFAGLYGKNLLPKLMGILSDAVKTVSQESSLRKVTHDEASLLREKATPEETIVQEEKVTADEEDQRTAQSAVNQPPHEDKPKPNPMPPPKTKESTEVIVVKEGDTLSDLANRIYGRSDEEILALILEKNPQIKDMDRISVGQEITFLPLKED
jgi:type II secretory pathway predicted ATPase ExeA/phage tail protein X